jgi:nucleoside-diphosphate-sugar epimerase
LRHLVTGGSGFVGSVLARKLLESGEDVRVLDIRDDSARPPSIEFIRGSICDYKALAAAMDGIDVVHHCAAIVAQAAARDACRETNVEGSRFVADAAARSRVSAFVHVSSTSVFGMPPRKVIDAMTPLRPFEPYGRSKLMAEKLTTETCSNAGILLITVRPRVTIGPGRLGIFELLFDWIDRGRRVFISGNGAAPVQLLHVDDLVDFIMLALRRGEQGVFNVGAVEFGSLNTDLQGLIAHAGSRSKITHVPPLVVQAGGACLHNCGLLPIGPWHYRTYHRPCVFDVAPLVAMGWTPAFSNAAMLCQAFDSYRSRRADERLRDSSPHRAPLQRRAFALLDLVA